MEADKKFIIGADSRSTRVTAGLDLGRILHRPEVSELARSYGSSIIRLIEFSNIEIVPPIPADDLDKFGEALVSLAQNLDPTPPIPTYDIAKPINE